MANPKAFLCLSYSILSLSLDHWEYFTVFLSKPTAVAFLLRLKITGNVGPMAHNYRLPWALFLKSDEDGDLMFLIPQWWVSMHVALSYNLGRAVQNWSLCSKFLFRPQQLMVPTASAVCSTAQVFKCFSNTSLNAGQPQRVIPKRVLHLLWLFRVKIGRKQKGDNKDWELKKWITPQILLSPTNVPDADAVTSWPSHCSVIGGSVTSHGPCIVPSAMQCFSVQT